jgi:hypothetical protein
MMLGPYFRHTEQLFLDLGRFGFECFLTERHLQVASNMTNCDSFSSALRIVVCNEPNGVKSSCLSVFIGARLGQSEQQFGYGLGDRGCIPPIQPLMQWVPGSFVEENATGLPV